MNAPWQAWRSAWRRERWLLRQRPWDWAWFTWVPLLAVCLVWSIFQAGTPRQLPIAVLDADHSAASRQLVRLLQASPGLRLAAQAHDPTQAQALMRRGDVMAVLWLPEGLQRDIQQGRAGRAVLLHNAQFATHSGLIQRDVRAVVATLSAGIELSLREKRGASPLVARAALEPLQLSPVSAYNTALDYEQFLATALVPTLLHIFAMAAGAWALGRELRDGTLATLWGISHRALPALLAKLWLPAAALTAVDVAFFLALADGRGWHAAGPLLPVLALHATVLCLYVALGAAAALASRSLRMALSVAGFITAPAFAYAGVAFPLLAMPVYARAWALALPLTHVLAAQTAVLQRGAHAAAAVLPQALLWLALTALVLVWSGARLRALAAQPSAWGRR